MIPVTQMPAVNNQLIAVYFGSNEGVPEGGTGGGGKRPQKSNKKTSAKKNSGTESKKGSIKKK